MHKDSCDTGITHRSAAAVEGDDVARVSVRAADSVVVTIDQDAARIAQRLCAGNIGANNVALEEIAGGVLSDDYTKVASAGIGRDQIARRRTGTSCQTADHSISDATIEIQANVWTTQSDCASYIRANEVALHGMVRSASHINA